MNPLVPGSTHALAQARLLAGDYARLGDVVRIGYPVQDAKRFLARQIGNPIRYRLVPGKRGDRIGRVQSIEVHPAQGGEVVHIESIRELPDGSEAGPFVPEDLVTLREVLRTTSGGPVPTLQARDTIVLVVPVRTYLRFLPALYHGAAPISRQEPVRSDTRSMRPWNEPVAPTTAVGQADADTFQRFMLVFQHLMTTVTDKIEAIPSLTDPTLADARMLPWIASWVGFELDESLPLHQQRELVKRSIRLYRSRGTRAGIEDMVRVLTSAPLRVDERVLPQPTVLGGLILAGGATVEERYLRGEPPGFYLQAEERKATGFFVLTLEPRERFRRRFGERAPQVLKRISQIVTAEKPSHVSFTLRFAATP